MVSETIDSRASEKAPAVPHTPGPWVYDFGTKGIYSNHPDHIHGVVASGVERLADCRLIGSAPDLLKACKDAVALSISLPYGLREQLEAAIAKAEGRAA